MTRSYGIPSLNTKLAFWYQLAEMIKEGTVVPVPANYKMTRKANIVLTQQITVLRNAVVDMGVASLA
ncbi:orange carotenoid protein N-terminal domain-containing protein [Microcystis aeruginosa]|uniref:orange carotenoid protein N-terminal domain-containing protein n=1 Tax=Microcystis TaxID=1125 RepID=UPI003A520D38